MAGRLVDPSGRDQLRKGDGVTPAGSTVQSPPEQGCPAADGAWVDSPARCPSPAARTPDTRAASARDRFETSGIASDGFRGRHTFR